MVARMSSPPGTSPRPVRPSLSLTMAMFRVKYGAWAPERFISIESKPATGTTSTSVMVGPVVVVFIESSSCDLAVDLTGQGAWVRILHRLGENTLGHGLVGDRAQEAVDRQAAHRSGRRRGCGREWSSVDHRVTDFDTGRPAVEQDSACKILENGKETVGGIGIRLSCVQRHRQLAFELVERFGQRVDIRVAEDHRGSAENLIAEHRIGTQLSQICREDHRCRGVLALTGDATAHSGYMLLVFQGGHALGEGLCDALRQHRLPGLSLNPRGHGIDESITVFTSGHEDETRSSAQLPTGPGQR